MKSPKYALKITAFWVGAITMMVEIVGLGVIAPYFGTALIVSANLIGFVLLSLSVGYIIGGKLADIYSEQEKLGLILLSAGLLGGILFSFRDAIANLVVSFGTTVVAGSFIAISILFIPINILFGMAISFIIKLSVVELSNSGKRSGSIYSVSSVGSVLGTFVAGFILIPYFSFEIIFSIIFSILILLSMFFVKNNWKQLVFIPVLFILFFMVRDIQFLKPITTDISSDGEIIIDRAKFKKIDDRQSQYSRIQIYEGIEESSKRPIRLMRVNKELHTGTYIGSNELMFKYSKFNTLAGHFNPNAKRALLIGGGGYSYAKYFLSDTPLFDIDRLWKLDGRKFSNGGTIALPLLTSFNDRKLKSERELLEVSHNDPVGAQKEGLFNSIEVKNQVPGDEIIVDRAKIVETGFPADNGYVHIHEVNERGEPGVVISPDVYIHTPRSLLGHSDLLHGENENVRVSLDRTSREGEVLYAMLHRDNGNGRFDDILVDGYSHIEALDVVEIDPVTTELAEKYFELNREDPRLRIFHEDGRTFINRTQEKYDIIYLDAFRSFFGVPFQLTTKEAAQKLYSMLNQDGVIVLNVPSALSGESGKFFQAEFRTYKEVFPEVRAFAVHSPTDEEVIQNIIILGFQSADNIRTSLNDDQDMNERLLNEWNGDIDMSIPILTDEFAPVDYYVNQFVNSSTL